MLGLALEGGGAKGAFHVGALKALYERGYEFGGVAGTSIGALNGAIVAQGDFDILPEVWRNISFSTLTGLDDEKFNRILARDFDRELIKYMLQTVGKTIKNHGLPMDEIRKFAEKYIDEQRLRESPTDYCLVTVSISDEWTPLELFKEEVPEGKMVQYILASAYFPVFNRPTVDGKRFMDGGMYNNCPITPLARKGYKEIIAIRTGSKMPTQPLLDRNVKVHYINPSESLGTTLDFRQDKITHNINLGYYDALRFTDGLIGLNYYIKPKTYAEAINYIESYTVETYSDIAKLLGVKGTRSDIMHRAATAIYAEIDDENRFDVFDAIVASLEYAGKICGVEKFKIYTLEEFSSVVASNWKEETNPEYPLTYEIAKAIIKSIK